MNHWEQYLNLKTLKAQTSTQVTLTVHRKETRTIEISTYSSYMYRHTNVYVCVEPGMYDIACIMYLAKCKTLLSTLQGCITFLCYAVH